MRNLDLFRAMFGSNVDIVRSDGNERKRAVWVCGCKAESIEIGEPSQTWWMLEWACVGHRDSLRHILESREAVR